MHCDLWDILAVTLLQYIKCPINYPSSSLLWCKYRIIRQLIKHRLKSLYTVFGNASAEPFCGLCWTSLLQTQIPQGEIYYNHWPSCLICFFQPFHFFGLAINTTVSWKPYSTLSRQPKIGKKNYALRHRSCFDVGDKPLKGREKNVVKH